LPAVTRPHGDPAASPMHDGYCKRRRQDHQLLEIAGAQAEVGGGALRNNFVELKLDVAIELRQHGKTVGVDGDDFRRGEVGGTTGRRLHAGAARQKGTREQERNGRVLHLSPQASFLRLSASPPACSRHAASFSRSRATTLSGARATNFSL